MGQRSGLPFCRAFVVMNFHSESVIQKTFRYLWRFYSLLFRGFFVVFSWLFRGPLLSRKTVFGPFSWLFRGFFVAFSWLFRGPCFGQNLRVLALEQSSESWMFVLHFFCGFLGAFRPCKTKDRKTTEKSTAKLTTKSLQNPRMYENNFDHPHPPY